MCSAWTVTVLAADGGLREGRVAVGSVVAGDRLRATAVAINTARLDDAVEAVVLFLIAGRKIPAPGLRVMGERRLEEIIATAQKRTKAKHSQPWKKKVLTRSTMMVSVEMALFSASH